MQIHLYKAFFSDDRFLDSLHKSFLNQTTLDLRKEKWTFLNREFTVLSIFLTLESEINVRTPMLINFWNFFQGLLSYYGLKRLKFYYISLHILGGYIYSFCQIFQRLSLFKGLHLFRTQYLEAAQLILTQPKKRGKGEEGISEGL